MSKTAPALASALIPYPQTPSSARAWIRAHGLCQTELARRIGVSRLIVVDLLRGQLKGHRGDAHRAAIALGLKADPDTLDLKRDSTGRRKPAERRAAA
ncbi:MAG: hypothetical protein KJZ96_15540 [Rhodocyclaceae bacterium]|nr:hypothetical protein [Rhodocyclaceae bacterium]